MTTTLQTGFNAKAFANNLVHAHPEYCKYQAMSDLVGEACYSGDNDFLNAKTYADGQTNGYPTGKISFTNLYATAFAINRSGQNALLKKIKLQNSTT